jgi:outer membrane immunogenic protein
MKKLLGACCALAALSAPAIAADMFVPKAPPPPVTTTWNGFYIGGNVGYGVTNDPITETTVAGPGLAAISFIPAGTPLYGGAPQFDLTQRTWNGGGQFGYNWQLNPILVVGFETDIQGQGANGATQNCVLPCNTRLPATPGLAFFPSVFSNNSVTSNLEWFGTVRGRVGYTNGPTLFYLTGGLAYGEIQRSGSVSGSTVFAFGGAPINSFAGSFNESTMKVGWTVGAGIEAQLMGNWTAKAEYLYVDLGTVTNTFNDAFFAGFGTPGVAATRTITGDVSEHIFRLGLNYKFAGMSWF